MRKYGSRWLIFFGCLLAVDGLANGANQYYVPHVVDGENPPERTGFFRTEFRVFNFSKEESTSVTIRLLGDGGQGFARLPASGPPGVPQSEITYELEPNGSRTTATTNGPITIIGAAVIESTGKVGVITTVQFVELGGIVRTSASVLSDPLAQHFSLDARTSTDVSGTSTGVALFNPSEVETAMVTLRLHTGSGEVFEDRTIELSPGERMAQFLNEGELFTELTNFRGSAEVTSSVPLSVMVIRLDNALWSTSRAFDLTASEGD